MLTDAVNRKDFAIKTERLMLVPIRAEHAEAYFEAFTPEVARYQFPEPFQSAGAARAFILEAQAFRAQGEELVLAILDMDGAFLGSAEARNLTSPTPEVGLWLKSAAQGRGYGKEAMAALLSFLRENGSVDFFVYEADRRNGASTRLAIALGGECQCAYDVEGAGGKLLRLKLYYIT
ncbi:MAG: GNAT family N-acetyltransferase [Clostridiaceae bacterium]|nr:GNAT family N-acetyltransferase [Eubacteriales bacterium]